MNFLHRDFAGMLRPLEYGQIVPVAYPVGGEEWRQHADVHWCAQEP